MFDPVSCAVARLRAHLPSWRELLGCTILVLLAAALLRWGDATMLVLTLSYGVFAIGYSLFRLFGGHGGIDLDQLWREVLNAVLGLC
ncbi:hypothetical protein NB688_001422 [Xanthomonas sacchari]|uniref:Uncharacterized protein n=1 Tax=Xanthomonas sacchari TaxID=56458 RepID=A0ABT3E1N3_9XANT|nr:MULTISPECIES: hypothetical protein [Xanthomonas]MCW0401664.1 hypothetical protein [Xanthomonas sacchari]MCW0419256.1 hypothetical protein [Xanthomonas sacchari]MDQ7760900.1 hypothetical protein [Xanthomonas sontii]TYD32572.1 hypothetical protein CEK63_17675 [Xanthomonas sontii]UYK74392.1 hypothetical protein NG828_08815 [Xanthomonas sacchari]